MVVADIDHCDVPLAFDYDIAVGQSGVALVVGAIDKAAKRVLGYVGKLSYPDGVVILHFFTAQHPWSNEIIRNPGNVFEADRSSAYAPSSSASLSPLVRNASSRLAAA